MVVWWKEAVLDALIQAGFNFFSTLAGLSVSQVVRDPVLCVVASSISAGSGFFGSLLVRRGFGPKKAAEHEISPT